MRDPRSIAVDFLLSIVETQSSPVMAFLFENLRVYQEAVALADQIIILTKTFPPRMHPPYSTLPIAID